LTQNDTKQTANPCSFSTDKEQTNKQIRQAKHCPELVTFDQFPLFVVGDRSTSPMAKTGSDDYE
jgi:hypothetical protein